MIPSGTRLDGRFEDRLVDRNGDGLVDHLRLGVGVIATDSIDLTVIARLSADGKPAMLGVASRRVGPGEQVLEVDAFLNRFARTGHDGPFVVDSLVLFESSRAHSMRRLDGRVNAHVTRHYTIAADTLRSPSWNGRVTARGVDTDGDGRFESLVVEVGVEGLRHDGRYYCSAGLARGSQDLSTGSEYLLLPRDSATVRLEFPGACIAANPAPGRLTIRYFVLVLLDESGRASKLPHTGVRSVRMPIEQDFAAGAFEPGLRPTYRSRAGGTYECR